MKKKLFEGISNARQKYSSAQTMTEKMNANNELNGFFR